MRIHFLLLFLISCSNSVEPTRQSMEDEIDSLTSKQEHIYHGSMEVEIVENDKVIFSTMNDASIAECAVFSQHEPDSTVIRLWVGMFVGFGMDIIIKEDSTYTEMLISSDDLPIYKQHQEDSLLQLGLRLKPIKQKLQWVDKPILEQGEIIKGIIEAESQEFWEVSNGQEKKTRISIKAWFKSEL